jgi:hypothetical protein
MDVKRVVHDNGGSHIEPPLDPAWSDLDKLRWHAGVLKADTGVEVSIVTGSTKRLVGGHWAAIHGLYGYNVGGSSGGTMTFDVMWSWINGLERGWKLAPLAQAWDEGFKQGGPMHDVTLDAPNAPLGVDAFDLHTHNPYRALQQ